MRSKPEYARKKDTNQAIIQEAITRAGYVCQDFSAVGNGVPDLLVKSKADRFVFLEVKTEDGKLTPKERAFFALFQGAPVDIARSPEEALDVLRKYD